MQLTKENIVYILTTAIAVIGILIQFLQSLESIVSVEYASKIALVIVLLGLGVPLIIKIIALLNTANEIKKAELLALKK